MDSVLVVIDMQNDFIDGSLGTDAAKNIVKNVCNKIEEMRGFGEIVVTIDTHEDEYLKTLEGKKLPVEHCIKHTSGWLLNSDVREALKKQNYIIFEKSSFADERLIELVKDAWERHHDWYPQVTIFDNSGRYPQTVALNNNDTIGIVGLCTDICVISNALMLRSAFPDIPITVYADCCAGTTKEKHEAALEVMRSCQIDVAYMK